MPEVQVTVSPFNSKLPNLVNPTPLQGGWQEGSLLYFKTQDPAGVKKAAALVADDPSAVDAWTGMDATMKHLGYTIVYETNFPETATYSTFVSDAIAMKNKGVKMLFIEQNPTLYAAPLIKALNAQNFHPMVVLGASTYSDTLIPTSGSLSATDGMYLEQDAALYLGTDAKAIPAVTTFLHWTKVATANTKPTLFTLYGWLSTQLFVQGLKEAGDSPTRGSLLKALGKITTSRGQTWKPEWIRRPRLSRTAISSVVSRTGRGSARQIRRSLARPTVTAAPISTTYRPARATESWVVSCARAGSALRGHFERRRTF